MSDFYRGGGASREAIFEVFRRRYRQDEVERSGIGLSICEKFVDRYHGELVRRNVDEAVKSRFHMMMYQVEEQQVN